MDTNSISWQCPSNIALVKYWGKHGRQLPMNPSVSMTLKNCHTQTNLAYNSKRGAGSNINVNFTLAGVANAAFAQKIVHFFESIAADFPFLRNYDYQIDSTNSFPHSSGIASSASGMGALALCVCSMARLHGLRAFEDDSYFFEKASFYARLGSGSASRSIYGPWAIWGESAAIPQSSDNFAIPTQQPVHSIYEDFNDVILIIDAGTKKVSSTAGHALMNTNRFATERYAQARQNLQSVLGCLENGDLERFISLVEEEALTLHALMMTSHPSFILMKPQTLSVLLAVREFRAATGTPLCFTLDAGSNAHLLFPKSHHAACMHFIREELLKFCVDGRYIADSAGSGPVRL